MCCDERGLAIFSTLRRRRNEPEAFLYAFDLLELDGLDMRREPIETRKATLASLLRKARHGVRLNEHIAHPTAPPCSSTPASWVPRDCVEAAGIAVQVGSFARLAEV